jgi:hypothetical protein
MGTPPKSSPRGGLQNSFPLGGRLGWGFFFLFFHAEPAKVAKGFKEHESKNKKVRRNGKEMVLK